MDDDEERWRGMYLLVLGALAVTVILLALLSSIYR
jgi:hypothetical protein